MFSTFLRNRFFLLLLALKIIFLALFSSDYKDRLFVPFVQLFLKSTWNPWEYYYVHSLPNPFPYPSLMLFILTPFQFIANLLPENYYLDNLIFKLPLLAADLVVFFILTKLFPARSKEVLALYFASPIIFYASYVHSQLDMIPTALILLALYFVIKEKPFVSSIIFGLALSTKFHVAAALPLILIYLWKKKVNPLTYLLVSIFTFGILLLPYINSIEFFNFVFKNKEQQQVLSVNFPIENLHIYLAVLVVVLIYIRFLMYSKVNKDLLFSYIGLLFACFLVFVPPMPGWYMWIIPFLFTYFINAFQFNNERIFILDAVFSLSYLLYFIFFHRTDLNDILIGGTPLHLKINSTDLKNVSYTILAGCLITVVYYLYNHGVRSNSIYKNSQQAFTIGIGGDSGVGKSTLLEDIKLLLNDKKMLEIEGDGDHKWERGDSNWEEYTHLNPKANHLHRQSEHLSSLKRGGTIERIVYDHVTGKFTSPILTKSNDFIVLSGLHPFYLPKMRKNIDLKIYLETDENLRRHWKIIRDFKKRGYTKEQVIRQINSRMPDAQKYIYPQKTYADLVITYFTDETYEMGNDQFDPRLLVKFTLDSNIDLDPLINILLSRGISGVVHDYSEDLQSQYLILKEPFNMLDFMAITNTLVQNREELISEHAAFRDGIRGMVQMMILIMIADKMKEEPLES